MPPFFQTVQQPQTPDCYDATVCEGITIKTLPDGHLGQACYSHSIKELEANGMDPESAEATTTGKKPRTGWRRYLGMIFTLSASLNFSFGVLFAKLLQKYDYHGNAASFWRYIGVTVPAIPMLLYYEYMFHNKNAQNERIGMESTTVSTVSIVASAKSEKLAEKQSVFKGVWPLTEGDNWKNAFGVFLRGFFAAAAVVLRYYALEYLPIGDTSVISYSTPVLVTILAHFLLGEKAGIVSFIIAFTTLVGVAIVAKPPMLTGSESFTTESLIGTGLAVASLVCASLQIVLTRIIRSVHFAFLTVTVGMIGLAIAGILMLHFQDFAYPTQLKEGLYVAGLTATSYFGQMSIILALKFELAGPVALIRCSDTVIGFILQFLFLDVIPEWTSVVGGLIVLSGVLVTGFRKYLQGLSDDASVKKRFRYILA